MEHSNFKIGDYFYTGSGRWKCTDIGTRVIVAMKVPLNPEREIGEIYSGPPYCIAEYVFDEYDLGGCSLIPFEEI